MQSLNVLLRPITVQPLLNGPPRGNEEWPQGGWPLIGGKHNRKALNGTCDYWPPDRSSTVPSNASVILQICENDAPFTQANTTSMI